MNIKQLAGAAAITTSVGLSAFTLGVGVFHATLSDPPPPCPTWMEPPTGGGPKSGGRAVQPHGFSPPLRSDS
jgi:hypothetical protein